MSKEHNQEVFRAIIEEGFNKGNYSVLDDLFAPDYQENQFGLHTNLEGFKKDIAFLRNAFPDFHLTIEDMITDEEKVWVRMSATGTNLGPFMGPPTGKTMQIAVFDILRFENGKAVEHWGVPDRFALMAQLGMLPQPAEIPSK